MTHDVAVTVTYHYFLDLMGHKQLNRLKTADTKALWTRGQTCFHPSKGDIAREIIDDKWCNIQITSVCDNRPRCSRKEVPSTKMNKGLDVITVGRWQMVSWE